MHLEHAEVLICEDEFKYALLANNCICPGISTFITLLMHTSKGDEGKNSTEPWHKVYGFHSGNELYMIKAEDSKFFGSFIGKSFTYASYCAHDRYGVGLIAVKSDEPNAKCRLNPGVTHIIKATDVLYYMALTNEESLYNFQKDLKDQKKKANLASTIANVGIETPYFESGLKRLNYVRKRFLRRGKARDQEALISGSLKMPSRSHPSMERLSEAKPGTSSESDNEEHCEKCKGPCIKKKLDNLLRAGVSNAEHVVVVKEFASLAEEHLADCSTIITVQKIHRMFPQLRMITELTHTSNMRFVQFSANNPYSLAQSKFEKYERKRGSHMPYMFRLPFAQGGVFSANMLDRLLYQAIIKPYVVTLTRLLLGIDQSAGSGYLSSVVVTSEDLWIKTYGQLYKRLCSSGANIPLGIFRTKNMDSKTVSHEMEERCHLVDASQLEMAVERRKEMLNHIRTRMRNLGITDDAESECLMKLSRTIDGLNYAKD
ncbi:Calcium-activated BK potassium channel alpha subunit [Cooperia oncophora]